MGKELIKAMTQVLSDLGYDSSYTQYPAKRGLLELKAGRIDGTLARVGDLNELMNTTNLKRVDYPVAVFNYSRWCRKGVKASQPRIRVASRLGSMAMSLMEPHLSVPPVELQEMKDQSSGVKMLKNKRLDCMLTTEMTLEAEQVTPKDLGEFDRADLTTFQLFPWLLDKHENLGQALAGGLRKYPFPPAFQRKFQSAQRVCEGKLNTLCPDGILFHKSVSFDVKP
jgi:ABC-type amino acid transport substrate-binding protein